MMRPRLLASLLLAATLALLSGCTLFATATTQPLIDRQLPAHYSGVAAVRKDAASPLVVSARGQALREESQPNTKDTRFMIGSSTKWITAVTVLRLADMGKLDLDAPIARHLPELPAPNGAVTLRQLLAHRSGIPNGLAEAMRKDSKVEALEIGPEEAALRFGTGAPAFAPGERFEYSGTNFILAAAVVERVMKKPFTEVVEELVFAPAGVRDTSFAATGYEDAVGMAVGYGADGKRKSPPAAPMLAANGTVYSTARDLVDLMDAVYKNKLLSERALRELSTVHDPAEHYALGGRVQPLTTNKGARSLAWEAGAFGGYKSLIAYDPADGRAVVLLNNADMPQDELAAIVTALFQAMDK
ncbi:serine hydrolase [Massilia sp. ST3]|uniref:serine hydrolase domain-containing protein n=1 Tax=Massilia sp. ST3 TaxID=2824903 RepID=UPI001B8461A3|nr:serine hydrolase domain-containing protein [Massilia sp. ST3]MBQ5948242.1 beta-lactamase family protein [Massilia sp. ST3]